jgi:hypothetical protein
LSQVCLNIRGQFFDHHGQEWRGINLNYRGSSEEYAK